MIKKKKKKKKKIMLYKQLYFIHKFKELTLHFKVRNIYVTPMKILY